jgi:HK97 family phage major capsid protein
VDLELLQSRYSEILERMNAISDLAKKEKRGVSEDESKEFDGLELELETVKRNIARAEKLAKENEERVKPTKKALHTEVTRSEGEDENGNCKVWGSLGEQLMAVKRVAVEPMTLRNSDVAQRLELSNKIMRAATGLQESIMAEGGYLIQQDGSNVLLEKARETGKLAGLVDRYGITSQSNGISFPSVDESSRVDGSRAGGIQAFWEGEGDTYTKSKPKLSKIELKLKKLTGLCYLTDELIEDAPVMEAFITRAFGREFGFKIDDAVINGTGAGMPLGILQHSTGLVSVAKESGQAAATLNATNLAKMFARLHEEDMGSAVWVYNAGVKSALMTLSLTVGSNTYPVFLPGGITGSVAGSVPVSTILGIPAFALEQCAALGTVGDILLINPKKYLWIDKGGVKAAQSIHVAFEKSETAFRFVYRADGQPAERTVLTPFKGSDTLGSYVALATRA